MGELGFFGRGIYSVADVARLAELRAERVRRWTDSGEIVKPRWPKLAGRTTLDFLDLVEMLFVRSFLKHGVSMAHIKAATKAAARELETSHPFAMKRFETDGQTIMVRLSDGSKERLVDLVGGQAKLSAVVMPLLKKLDHDASDVAKAWWPLGRDGSVVLDPTRSFGAPILDEYGIQTRILAGPVAAGDTMDEVARWFRVPATAVATAVAFERALASA